jgi:hypothetical protein
MRKKQPWSSPWRRAVRCRRRVVRYREIPPPGTPLPAPDMSDMDRIHCVIRTDQLAEVFTRLADGHR